MKQKRERFRSTDKKSEEVHLTRINRIIAVFVVLFFVGIIFIYYNMLYSAKRKSIIREGEVTAKDAADDLDQYLATNIDSIKLSAYTLDGMITENRSDQEIQDFLVGQSTAIKNAVNENSTGLYGYINGRFFSGTNWVPPAGYDATIRPWYTKPMEHPGEITILDPYVDVQTGNVMLALGKTLVDGKSVVSVDVSLGQVQKIMEDSVANGYSDIEMVLNDKGIVVAHSDPAENGKNYYDETDTLGALIVRELDCENHNSYEFHFHGMHYIVYVAHLQNRWHCISVIDATKVFGSLNMILLGTIIIMIIVVLIVSSILKRSNFYVHMSHVAMEANEAKSAFLSNMSHEIRTPINAMLGMNEMILRESNDRTILTYAQNIRNAGKNLLGLVNDILDFSKIEAGKIEILPGEYDLSSVINDLVNIVDIRTEKKGLLLHLEIDKEIPNFLCGDASKIKQVTANLLTNAVKYTEEGSVTFCVGYEKVQEEDAILLIVQVRDTGIGIREKDMEKLYSRFERLEEDRNRTIEGAGLGLSITKNLLEMMGTELEVESTYGEGSCFGFRIRQKVTGWEALGDYAVAWKKNHEGVINYHEKFKAPEALILAVDDNLMNLIVFQSLVKQTGVKTDTAESGDEAIQRCKERKYDMIFLDHMMPEKDGIEALKEIRENTDDLNHDTPIVCLTANAIAGSRENYLKHGFDDYMTKPIDPEELEKMMIRYLPEDKVILYETTGEKEADEELQPIPKELEGLCAWGIDVAGGIVNSGGETQYRGLLKLFYDAADAKAKEIDDYYRAEDFTNYTIRVHALKSSARIIGCVAFGEDAQHLENASKSGDIGYVRKNHAAFLDKLSRIKEQLQILFPEEKAECNKPLADAELMAEVFSEIATAAEDMDCDRLESIFLEMEEYSIPEQDAERFQKIKTASQNYDYHAIITLLQNEG